MEMIMRKILKAIALTGAIILVIAPSIKANFVPSAETSILMDIFQKINTAISPTTAYLFAIGIISLIVFDKRGTRQSRGQQ